MGEHESLQGAQSPTQLHGWKEIAAYFGRSVRTVQRWERDFGLPIRRFGLGRSEVVHAYVEELERWKSTSEAEAARRAGADAVDTGGSPEGVQESETVATWRRSSWGLLIPASALAVAVTAGFFALRWANDPAQTSATGLEANGVAAKNPATWDCAGNVLSVKNAEGTVLWRHTFPFRLDNRPDTLEVGNPEDSVRIEDVDGDGLEEVLVRTLPSYRERADFRFYAFSHDGTLRWRYVHGNAQTFGGTEYTPPYLAHRIITTPRAGGGKNVWLVSVHSPWFPSVMSLTRHDGTPSAEYWSNGHINKITEGIIQGRRVVLVGARNNESEGASVAMLDADHPAGSAPADEARYRCTTCPPGQPLRFVKILKPDGLKTLRGSSPVMRISVDGLSHIIVWVNHVLDWEPNLGEVIYTFDADLRPLSAVPSDSYAAAYRSLQAKQLIAAPADSSPGEDRFPVRWWNGEHFVDLDVPRASPNTGPAR